LINQANILISIEQILTRDKIVAGKKKGKFVGFKNHALPRLGLKYPVLCN
jgi:hypothetical protein